MIATNTQIKDMNKYVEVIDLVNPQFQRKFIERRLEYTDTDAEVGGLLQNSPVLCDYNGRIDCLVIGNPNAIVPKLLKGRQDTNSTQN